VNKEVILNKSNPFFIVVDFLKQLNEKEVLAKKKKGYTCSFCGEKFKTRLAMITHKRERHGVV